MLYVPGAALLGTLIVAVSCTGVPGLIVIGLEGLSEQIAESLLPSQLAFTLTVCDVAGVSVTVAVACAPSSVIPGG